MRLFYRSDIKDLRSFNKPIKGEITIVISEPVSENSSFDEQKKLSTKQKNF